MSGTPTGSLQLPTVSRVRTVTVCLPSSRPATVSAGMLPTTLATGPVVCSVMAVAVPPSMAHSAPPIALLPEAVSLPVAASATSPLPLLWSGVTVTPEVVGPTASEPMTSTELNGPHAVPLSPRTYTTCCPVASVVARADAVAAVGRTASVAESNAPSVASIAVPAPGAPTVSTKYSAPLTVAPVIARRVDRAGQGGAAPGDAAGRRTRHVRAGPGAGDLEEGEHPAGAGGVRVVQREARVVHREATVRGRGRHGDDRVCGLAGSERLGDVAARDVDGAVLQLAAVEGDDPLVGAEHAHRVVARARVDPAEQHLPSRRSPSPAPCRARALR